MLKVHSDASDAHPLNKKTIIMVTSCTSLICALAVLLSVTKHIPASWVIEIATTSLAVAMSVLCLIHVYHEHKLLHEKEMKLKQNLLHKIMQVYVNLPRVSHIEEHIESLLEKHSSAQLRFETLKHYYQNKDALDTLVDNINQEYLDMKVLDDLGLNWEKESSNHYEHRLRA